MPPPERPPAGRKGGVPDELKRLKQTQETKAALRERKPIQGPQRPKGKGEPKDDEAQEFIDSLAKWRDELPSNKIRYTMIVGFTILILLVVYLGYAYGIAKVCGQVGGTIVKGLTCLPDLNQTTQSVQTFDSVGMPFRIPNITIQDD